MGWREEYQSKLTTAEEAVKLIKSGDRVVLGHAVGEPEHLVDAMAANYKAYQNVEVVQMIGLGKSLYTKEEMEGHFRFNGIFLGAPTRGCVAEKRGDFTPSFFYQVPSLIKEELKPDVAMIQVSEPDNNGFCSLGVAVDYTYEAAKSGKTVIAQVNKHMPRALGECFVHVSELDAIVEHHEPLKEIPIPVIGEAEKAIGKYCAELVNDGDTLQLGIGAIPDAVLASLTDKKDLGIHSEMVSDGVLDLVEAGIINCKKKNFNKDKMVITFIMGTKRLYDFVNDNPMVMMAPVDYVNDPRVVGENDNLVSINAAVQVDLMGQVCSESIGLRQFSGIGGQVDFVRGASFSKGGRSILAFPSTAKKGTVSKIVPFLDEGATVTTSRTDVDYIVTEFGIAKLKGKSLRERAKALIGIAHPNFRESLMEEYKKRFEA